jgi:predicted small secreted protein
MIGRVHSQQRISLMRKFVLAAAAAGAALTLGACSKTQEGAQADASEAAATISEAAGDIKAAGSEAAGDLKAAGAEAAGDLKAAGADAVKAGAEKVSEGADKVKEAADKVAQ